ncbi:MAG: hypothetical protein ACRD9R_03065 [Pyrinomonadaceae bacterium]
MAEPLRAAAPPAAQHACDAWALIVHDWSPLRCTDHESKPNPIVLYNKKDFGYLWQTATARHSCRSTSAWKPLRASTAHAARRRCRAEIDEVNRTLGWVEQ